MIEHVYKGIFAQQRIWKGRQFYNAFPNSRQGIRDTFRSTPPEHSGRVAAHSPRCRSRCVAQGGSHHRSDSPPSNPPVPRAPTPPWWPDSMPPPCAAASHRLARRRWPSAPPGALAIIAPDEPACDVRQKNRTEQGTERKGH